MVAKRPLSGAALAAKKRKMEQQQANPVDEMLQSVHNALQCASEVPLNVVQMLMEMLPGSVGVFRDERHPYQSRVVDMIGTVLGGTEAQMHRTIENIEAQIAGMAAERVIREAAVTSAEEVFSAKREVANKNKYELGDDAKAFKAAKEKVAAAKASVTVADKDLQALVGKKALLEGAVNEFVKPLAAGTVGRDEATMLVESLMSVLRKFQLDESMMTALPTALAKEPSMRGSFDTTLVTQLDEAVSDRLAALSAQIAEADAIKAKHSSELKSGEAAFDSARMKQHSGAEAFNKARAEQKEAEDALAHAKEALANLDPEEEGLQVALKAAKEELQAFIDEPKKAFHTLSQRVAPPVQAAADTTGDVEV